MERNLKCNLFIGVSLLMIMSGCAHTQLSEGYVLKGTLEGVESGKVKLMKYNESDRTYAAIDSADLADGVFQMEGMLESPEMLNLVIEPGNWSISVFMENNQISIKADTTNATHFDWTQYGGEKGARIKEFTVSGSKNQDDWIKYENDPALKKFEPAFATLQEAYKAAGSNKDKAEKVRYQMDSLRRLLTALQKNWIDSFVTAHPASAAGSYLFHNYYQFNESMPLQEMESLLGKFTGPAKSTVYFKNLSDAINKKKALQPGNIAPDFTLLNPDSSSFSLSSLRGKYVLLDFWASWCVPCRKAIPHWKELYKKYQPQGFEILAITNDSRWSDWFKALEEEKMPWIQVADEFPVKNMPARVAELYMIPFLPSYTLIDQEGRIILHNASKQQVEEKLKEVIGS